MIDWIVENKSWFLSGLGIFIVSLIIAIFRKLFLQNPQENLSKIQGSGRDAYIAGQNIFIENRSKSTYTSVPVLVIFIVVIAVLLLTSIFFNVPFPVRNTLLTEKKVIGTKKEFTLHDAFKNDFFNYPNNKSENYGPRYSINSARIYKFRNTDDSIDGLKTEYIIHYDLVTNSAFLSIYIPLSQYAYTIAMTIADDYKTILDHEAREVRATGKDPGDSATLDSKNVQFSRRIFIYHEDYLTLEQLGFLEILYKEKNLSAQFRGRDYLAVKQLRESN